ncbi:TPA: uracil-DNA glycosylase [candidate division WOR-3 bacterium]|jgi:DNA polymerase|uniref:Type-4 uracil-DNA glycosylase n=1 Tax=candidate division WOR-3 bacterium TaxID=2052148 RepID=A0A350H9Q4_UNCW3|nr:uracil-DNA glycosylase [candidate division WOR-3 bacterium]
MDKIVENLINYLEFEKRHYRKELCVLETLVRDDTRLNEDIHECRKCELYINVKNKVIGSGDSNSDIMLVGEAPGEEEDKRGIPFVGKAGEKLEEMLNFIGLTKESVYICNVLKCRPPHNADPTAEQESACREFLIRQIKIVKPKIIMTLGRHAASAVLKNDSKNMYDYINKEFQTDDGIKVIATYHPAAILYSKGETKNKIRKQVADDLKRLKKMAGEQ